ncbi:nucleoside monophosphate kinase [Streptomyces mutabilis]|uniref:nucleoside monophosphate kinase n=1 Tax=Streptomyces mutabilis TaxID=67332 RepID=UPI0006947934|nr:nucleoside monophosphate kinase [Streptomyces mutabilis]
MRTVLISPPEAGKDTQARLLAERLSIPVISTGGLLRAHVGAGTALGRQAKRYMDSCALVPDHVTATMTADRLPDEDAAAGFLLQGFPRTVRQTGLLHESLVAHGTALDRVLAFEVPDDDVVRRLSGRRNCRECGVIQHAEPASPARHTGPSLKGQRANPIRHLLGAERAARRSACRSTSMGRPKHGGESRVGQHVANGRTARSPRSRRPPLRPRAERGPGTPDISHTFIRRYRALRFALRMSA